ncbi:MAG: putative ABC transport system permease protein [Planctomycetota bacterium]|jgi:putative ABC transport system permease protein
MNGFGTLFLIVRRSMRQHALSTTVTVLAAALASGLAMAVISLSGQASDAFAGGPVGFDAVVGSRGSKTQLVLNTIFHVDASGGNIPWSMYESLKEDRRVELAIPYALGDNLRGFRVIGTSQELFTKYTYRDGSVLEFEGAGEPFDPAFRQAVIGAAAARELGLQRGDTFQPSHGLTYDPDDPKTHAEQYVVSGVLKPTYSPNDRIIWIPIEGIFRMEDHKLYGAGDVFVAESGQEIPDEHKEISAVMLKLGRGGPVPPGFALDQTINRQGKVATFAWPLAQVMADIYNKYFWVADVLKLIASLVVVVAGASLLASIYNTMNERRREFAILRALGAGRMIVFTAIVLEAKAIALMGSILGYGVYFLVLRYAVGLVEQKTGVLLDPAALHPVLLWGPLGMLGIGALAGILPAWKAYSTDVARTLSQSAA